MNIRTFKLIVILSASLFLFAFITRTVYEHNLPRVVVEFTVSDSIRHHHRATGYVFVSEDDEGGTVFNLPNTAVFVEKEGFFADLKDWGKAWCAFKNFSNLSI